MIDETDDFGFSMVSEIDLKKNEEELKKKIEDMTKMTIESNKKLKEKLDGLKEMIMPLLNNLAKDPDKEYILWPNRADKIQAFIKKVNDFVDG